MDVTSGYASVGEALGNIQSDFEDRSGSIKSDTDVSEQKDELTESSSLRDVVDTDNPTTTSDVDESDDDEQAEDSTEDSE